MKGVLVLRSVEHNTNLVLAFCQQNAEFADVEEWQTTSQQGVYETYIHYLITHNNTCTHTHTHTHKRIHIFNLRSLKCILKHLKRSYMSRSHDHPQRAYFVPCWSYNLKRPVNYLAMLILVLWQHVLCCVWVVRCLEWAWLWLCIVCCARCTAHDAQPF